MKFDGVDSVIFLKPRQIRSDPLRRPGCGAPGRLPETPAGIRISPDVPRRKTEEGQGIRENGQIGLKA